MRSVLRFASAAATLGSGDSSVASAEEPVWQAFDTSEAALLGAGAGAAGPAFCARAGEQTVSALRRAATTTQYRAWPLNGAVGTVVATRQAMRLVP